MKPIAISVGEPAGIGPELILKLIEMPFTRPVIAITDKRLIKQRAKLLGQNIDLPLYQKQSDLPPFSILDLPFPTLCEAGRPDINNSPKIIEQIERAATGCLHNEFAAMVTGPINKNLINQAGIPFSGHTEYLAKITQAKKPVMMFVTDHWRLMTLTTHIPLSAVPQSITQENIISSIKLANTSLIDQFGIPNPKILVTGLNPHAGENGCFGQEEQTVIEPALNELRQQNLNIIGPVSADSAFQLAQKHAADLIVTMYHDQGLGVIKTLSFGKIVNITLGLPIIRSSVDHGTAFDIAGTGQANADSLINALQLAIKLAGNNDWLPT